MEDVEETDPSHPNNNKVTFSVTAVNQAGNPLTYQWHVVVTSKKTGKILTDYQLQDGGNADHVIISGAKTNKLTVSVPIEACLCSYEYYCQVISRDAEGYQKEIKSEHAALRTQHNYGDLRIFDSNSNRYVSVVLDDGTEKGLYGQGSKYHNYTCCGASCGHSKLPAGTRHTFVFEEDLGRGSYKGQSAKYYFYVWKCSECGYKELRASSTQLDSTTFDYSITIVNTKGAYIMDSDDITRTTARQGEKMYATAPAKDAFGNAFKEWKVVEGPDGFTVSQYVDGGGIVPGCFYFIMPAGNITLEAVYYTASEVATSIKIVEGYGFGFRDIDGSLTMEVTDENKLYVKLTPDSLAPKMIVWDVLYYDSSNPQLIFMEESASATSNTTSEPVDSDHGVKIEAKAPGIVRLRATVQDSGGKVSDTITVKILPSPTSEEPGHEKHNFPGGGTRVHATCTTSGYTVHQCDFPGCEVYYRDDFKNPLGHKDADGDGLCDNVDKNTNKICGYQMPSSSDSGNMSMVGLKKIHKVELTVDAPVRGGVPAATATPTGDEKDCFNAAQVSWDPLVKTTFDGGTKYSVLIKLEAKDGYGFKLDGTAEITNTQFYINGSKATVVYKDSQEASITYEFPATGTGSSSSGSGSGSTTYTVKVLDSKNGSVTADRKTASAGTTVTLTVSPDKGYILDDLTVLDRNDKEIKLTEKNGKYTFTMPASNVEVEATFKAVKSGNPFVDVPSGAYYEDAVIWAVKEGVTGGTSATTFNPNGICTRAQAVTFLWRAAGSPAPKSTVMPFTDVAQGSYYEQAVLWAVENGITKGTGDTTFSPNATCSRAQIVTFLWRSQKSPAAGSVNPFTDVSADAYYADAVLWAVKESVTSGTTATTFSPNADCTRAQIVTFIYRALAE